MFLRSDHRCAPRNRVGERGTSLIEYGLVTSLFLVSALGVLSQLTDNSEDVLNDSGRDISTPRPYDEELGDSPVALAPDDYVPPVTQDLLTFVEKQLEMDGRCLAINGSGPFLGNCGAGNVVTVTALSEDALTLTLAIDGTGQCLGADGDDIVVMACGNSGSQWTQDDVSGVEVIYRNVEAGLCLTKDGNGFELDDCSTSLDQIVLVQW